VRPYYERAGVTIYHGDAREVLPFLVADVLVTDPPYGIDHASNKPGAPRRRHAIVGDHDTTVRDAVLAWWAARPALVFGTCRAAPPAGARAILVWDKGGHVGMGDLALPWKQNWEHIYVLGRGFAGRRGSGVLRYLALWPAAGVIAHPHEKPVPLLRDLIGKCPPGAVLDPFCGSGTTLRAAMDLGRRAIGVEVEERYCELAARRLDQDVLPLFAQEELS
jgi:site-specific DNA-methyltransferase (adenine-specific)